MLWIYLSFALGMSFISSVLESVILSVSPSYIAMQSKIGAKSADLLARLKQRIDRSLAAILTINTISHTVGAAGVGAAVATDYGSKYVGLGSGIMTLLILVVAEIIPKTLGAAFWRKLAPIAAYTIQFLIFVTYPIVVSLEAISQIISRRGGDATVTREEVMVIAEMGGKGGTLHERETQIIRNVLRLDEIRVNDILTPRSVMIAFQQDRTCEDIVMNEAPLRFSRLPIFTNDVDEVTGFVLRFQIFEAMARGEGARLLSSMKHSIDVVPESKTVRALLYEFMARRGHMALVVDEYGGTSGIVTLEDAIETLLGLEIVDEFDNVADMRKWARELWEKRIQDELAEKGEG